MDGRCDVQSGARRLKTHREHHEERPHRVISGRDFGGSHGYLIKQRAFPARPQSGIHRVSRPRAVAPKSTRNHRPSLQAKRGYLVQRDVATSIARLRPRQRAAPACVCDTSFPINGLMMRRGRRWSSSMPSMPKCLRHILHRVKKTRIFGPVPLEPFDSR